MINLQVGICSVGSCTYYASITADSCVFLKGTVIISGAKLCSNFWKEGLETVEFLH